MIPLLNQRDCRRLKCWLGLFLAGLGSLLWPVAGTAAEQLYFARSWQVEDGLPENSVLGTAQTPDGFLWVATHQGLFYFDGIRFQEFAPVTAAGRPTAYLEALLVDHSGRLWVAKNRGVVVCVAGDTVESYTVEDAREDFKASGMVEDGEGGIWIAYQKGQPICRIKDQQVQTFGPDKGVLATAIHYLAVDRAGQLWFSRNGALGVFRDGRFQVLLKTQEPAFRLACARDGGIWAGVGGQVWKFREGSSLEPVAALPPDAGRGGVARLFEDRTGQLWAGTAGGKLFWLEGNEFKDAGLDGADILSLSDDREGNLWVGTRVAGLNRIRSRALQMLGRESGWNFGRVQSVCQDADGAVWAVGNNGLLARWENDCWSVLTTNADWAGLQPVCVAADLHDGVWIGTISRGLLRWQAGILTNAGPADILNQHLIRALHVDADGAVWIGQESPRALRRWRNGKLTTFELPPGKHAPRALAEDTTGSLWAANSDGALLRVTGDELVDETARTLPEAPSIRTLHCTSDGSLWIGYAERGLGRLKDGKFFRFDQAHGLPEGYISQILSDSRGRLWLAGNRGIFSVSLTELDAVAAGRAARVAPMVFGRDEGLPRFEASFDIWPNAARDEDGNLLFSTPTGLLLVRPENVLQSPAAPPVVIERLTANGRPVAAYHRPNDAASNAVPLVPLGFATNQIRLGPGAQQVELEFTALGFTAPENVQFRYRLEGRDSAWVDVGSHRKVRFERLTPGEYRFEVTACNREGVWNQTAAVLLLTVRPHFWETRWFVMGTAALVLIAIAGVVRLVERRKIQRQIEKLERDHAIERERTRIAKDLHDDLGSSLTQIALLSHFAQSPNVPPEQARADIQKVGGMAREMTRSLAEIVWAVNPRNDTLESFVSYACHLAEDSLRVAGIRCMLDTREQLPARELTTEIRHNLLMVVKEAINNVIKHAAATEVWLRVQPAPKGFCLIIEDNGRGFDPAVAVVPPDGSGNGLLNMRKRVESLGGQISIISQPGVGARIEVQLPLE